MNWFNFEFNTFLLVFIILNVVNVVIQTFKSIATIKYGKVVASITNAVAYGLYTIVVVFMTADGLGLLWKALIIAVANLIGVYVVKWLDEKAKKDRLWKVEATIPTENKENVRRLLGEKGLSFNYIEGVGKYTIFNIYCGTQSESIKAKSILELYNAKYFVSETKVL